MGGVEEKIGKIARFSQGLSLREFVEKVASSEGLPVDKAAFYVYLAWKKGYIRLSRGKPIASFVGYVSSIEALWFHALVLTVAFTLLLVFTVKEPPLVYLRYVLGSLFVLYIPGATLIEALYPRGEELEPLERLALSIGLSLALVPLVGLVLNYTPWGIRLTPIAVSLAFLSLLLAFIAVYRKYTYYRLSELV